MAYIFPRQINSSYQTQQLTIQDAAAHDADDMQCVYDSCRYLLNWEGKAAQYDQFYMRKLLAKPDYPPNGHPDNLRIQTIRDKATGQIVGVLEVYHGYPADNCFWLSMLLIKKEFQSRGLGQEIMRALFQQVNNLAVFQYMQCSVYLKNWPGIRFWTQLGFNQIVKYYGDKEHGADDFAAMVLRAYAS